MSDTITVRRNEPADESELDRDGPMLHPGEAANWGMFGIIDRQELDDDGHVLTYVRPRTDGGARALQSAARYSPRHTTIVSATDPT